MHTVSSHNPQTLSGIIYMSAAVFLFSLLDILAKWLASNYPVNQIIFFRMLFGLLPAIILLRSASMGSSVLYTRRPLTHLWRAATGLGAMGLFFYALPLMPLGDAVALSFAKTFLLALLAVPLLGERLTTGRMVGTCVGFLGVILIIRPSGAYEGWAGPAFALASALCFALSMITIRRLSATESTPLIVFYYTATAALVSGVSLLWGWVTPTPSALGLFIVLGVVGGIGQLFMTAAFRYAPASVVGPFNYAAIIWAALFGYLIWHEQLDIVFAMGATIIIVSGVWLARHEKV